jgi:hypothetical protein
VGQCVILDVDPYHRVMELAGACSFQFLILLDGLGWTFVL